MKLLRSPRSAPASPRSVAFAGVGRPGTASSDTAPPPAARSITVSGSGTVIGDADAGRVRLRRLARAARRRCRRSPTTRRQMRKLIAALEGAGIPATSLQTSVRLAVAGDVRRRQRDRRLHGARTRSAATIADISRAGAIVDAAVAAGANQVDGPSLTVADQTTLYDVRARGGGRRRAREGAACSRLRAGCSWARWPRSRRTAGPRRSRSPTEGRRRADPDRGRHGADHGDRDGRLRARARNRARRGGTPTYSRECVRPLPRRPRRRASRRRSRRRARRSSRACSGVEMPKPA